jgi:diaminopimelate epimerase
MRFIKMHGIGNDYVYINGFAEPLPEEAALPQLARRMADRHLGVGGDGMILVLPPDAAAKAQGAHVRMRMFNADGSEAEMCGNGVRCVCKLAHDHHVTPSIRAANPMRVQTGNGVLALGYEVDAAGLVAMVTVDMGQPILEPARIPVAIESMKQVVDHPTDGWIDWNAVGDTAWTVRAGLEDGKEGGLTCVSMGNPHAVFFVKDVAAVPLERVGPMIEHHRLFPRRINVHFVQVHRPGEVTMRTWERGSGITLACGTGACAVAVAGVLTGRTQRALRAHLPGGDLVLQWTADTDHVLMTGPATQVFEGEWPG